MAKIEVLAEFCKGCGLCVTSCPRGVLQISEQTNPQGYYVAEVVNNESCIGCGLCGLMCPDVALAISK